jgi:hypothetical protein
MSEVLDKKAVKAAVREVMDELSITYAHGAGVFLDSVMNSMADVANAFDRFYTNNLAKDRPEAAVAFLELRIRSARTAVKIVSSKIEELEKLQSQINRHLRSSMGRTKRRRAK